jgi:hypothetical protein
VETGSSPCVSRRMIGSRGVAAEGSAGRPGHEE